MTQEQTNRRTWTDRAKAAGGSLIPVRRLFAADTRDFFLILGTTLFLVVFGLVMVLSASSVESFAGGAGFFDRFTRQLLFAVIGVPLMLVASRMSVAFWKKIARYALMLGLALQVLVFVPGLGIDYGGNQNWISIAGFSLQPSEFLKLALAVWIGWMLERNAAFLDDWKKALGPIILVSGLGIALVLGGSDLGTAGVMLAMVFGMMLFAGIKLRHLLVGGVVVVAGALLFASFSLSRVERITAWMEGCSVDDYQGVCWQPQHGLWALAAGGWFGRGLGNSDAKWSWLPHADNDFIFAIVGEELGLIGAIVVLAVFVVLALGFVRVIRGTEDTFVRVVTAGIMMWIVGQALINIAVVLGLLPVLGVPLPLISSGGSALVATLLAIGVVLSFTRQQSESLTPASSRSDLS